jgi:hypothetical protein
MKRSIRWTMAIVAMTVCSLPAMGSGAHAQVVGPVADTFLLTTLGKEWCQGNPKFVETIRVKAADLVTLTITRDPLGTGDLTNVQVAINTNGNSADIDAIVLHGLAFPGNLSGSKAESALSGVNPANPAHFFTILGHDTFDKLGHMTNLMKVTGTYVYLITGTYTMDKLGTQSGPVECLGSGTFSTGKKILGP